MNTITSTAQHPDHGLSAVPSVDLTNGVDLTHQFTLDRHPKLGFFNCHDLAVSALGGLIAAQRRQQLVHGADDQDRSKGEKPCVAVTERVEGESSACANERNGDSGSAHGSGLGFFADHRPLDGIVQNTARDARGRRHLRAALSGDTPDLFPVLDVLPNNAVSDCSRHRRRAVVVLFKRSLDPTAFCHFLPFVQSSRHRSTHSTMHASHAESFAMKRSFGDQIRAYVDARGIEMADLVKELREAQRQMGETVNARRQHIEYLYGHPAARRPGILPAIAMVMGATEKVLLAGKYEVPAGSPERHVRAGGNVQNITSNMTNGRRDEVTMNSQLSGSILSIPTDMPFSNYNLRQTITLLGNILGALPMEKRLTLRRCMSGLLEFPESHRLVASQAIDELKIPDHITSNLQLNKWLAGDMEVAVETRPAPL